MRIRSLPFRRNRWWFSPPSTRYESLLGLAEQGAFDLGQGSPLKAFHCSLYPIESVAFALQAICTRSIGDGVAFVVFKDDVDTGHWGFVSFDSRPTIEQMQPIYPLSSSRANGQDQKLPLPDPIARSRSGPRPVTFADGRPKMLA